MGKAVADVRKEKITKYKTGNQTFKDFPVGTRVQVIVPCQDMTFFWGETGTVVKCNGSYLGIIVKFDRRFHRDDFNFEPSDLRILKPKKRSAFASFFEEPVDYGIDGYAVLAEDEQHAIEKFTDYFMEWQWIPRENKKYVIYQARRTMRVGWVKWHGFIDDDGELHNGWVLYQDDHWRQPRFKKVYVMDYDKHYFEFGHHWETTVDDYGYARHMRDCNVCGKVRW